MSLTKIQLWTPGITDFRGGIQVYSGFLRDALATIVAQSSLAQATMGRPATSCPIQVFALHDRIRVTHDSPPLPSLATWGMGQWPQAIRPLVFALSVIRMALGQPPTLIIATHLNLAVIATQLKRYLGISYWVVAHGFEAWEIAKPTVRQALLQADRVMAVSSYTRDRLLQTYDLEPERVVVLADTFDQDRFQIAAKPVPLLQRHGLQPDQPLLLTVNRLAKGEDFHPYDQVLAALPQIRQQLPTVHYLIVGEGGDRPRLEAKIRDLGLEDCVTLTGFISDDELPGYYNLCDCFVLPSKLEGFGIVCLEALASGKPVLASQVDGCSSALVGGELGVLVDPDDVNLLAQQLTTILQGRHEHALLYQPQQLRQRVIEKFGPVAFRQQLQRLLQDISVRPTISQNINHEDSSRHSLHCSGARWPQPSGASDGQASAPAAGSS